MSGGVINSPDGKKFYQFEYHQPVAQEPEPAAVSTGDYAPFFAVSSFRNRIEQGRDYQKHAAPRTAVTAEVQAIADDITRGLDGRRTQIDALYRWVVKNIRYVSVIIDRSGLIPNTTEDILKRRYGDCKDHATLLGALLKAKGIDSSPALINLGDAYTLPEPAAISPLNHVIIYIPQEDLFLDSTAQTVRPGDLYTEIAGKPVVLTAFGRMGRTPDFTAETNRSETDIELMINAEGRIKGQVIKRVTGQAEILSRDWAVEAESGSMENNVRDLLAASGESGTGRYTVGDPHDLEKRFEVRTEFELEPLTNMPGPAGWKIPAGLIFSGIRHQLSAVLADQRRTPFVCASATIIERYRILFPESLKIAVLPENVRFESPSLIYSADYVREDNVLRVERRVVKSYGKSVCGAGEWEQFKGFQAAVRRDLRAQFVYF